MELGHLLTRSGLTYPEVSLNVYHDSFCQLGSSVSLPWVIYFEAFFLHVVSSFSCIPVNCPKLALFLTSLQFVHLCCNKYGSLSNSEKEIQALQKAVVIHWKQCLRCSLARLEESHDKAIVSADPVFHSGERLSCLAALLSGLREDRAVLRGWSPSFKNVVVHTEKQSHFFRLWNRRRRLC